MPRPQQQRPGRHQAMRRRSLSLALIGAISIGLAGCKFDVAGFNSNCKKVKSDLLQVGPGQSCNFRYDGGDVARYVVVVTRPPTYGNAVGNGKYLQYVARQGFVGDDRLTIKVERRGVGHVQWETLSVKVKVGPMA